MLSFFRTVPSDLDLIEPDRFLLFNVIRDSVAPYFRVRVGVSQTLCVFCSSCTTPGVSVFLKDFRRDSSEDVKWGLFSFYRAFGWRVKIWGAEWLLTSHERVAFDCAH
jgi:hypothetical protein